MGGLFNGKSSTVISFAVVKPIIKMDIVVSIQRAAMNLGPKNLASLTSMGILTTAQVLSSITILEILAPLANRVLHTGKAAYMGPAEKLPNKNENTAPFNPDSVPKLRSIAVLGTQALINAVSSSTTGIMVTISKT